MYNENEIHVVTSFSQSGYTKYGRTFIESFKEHWPKGVNLHVYYHNDYNRDDVVWAPDESITSGLATCSSLDTIPETKLFKDHAANLISKMFGQKYDPKTTSFRIDAVKFSNKVFALANANASLIQQKRQNVGFKDAKWLIWLDADTYCTQKITIEDISKWLDPNAHIVYLGRDGVADYAETSFIAFNMDKDLTAPLFIDDFVGMYMGGEFRFYSEWHDGFIFERLLKISTKHGLITSNLSKGVNSLEAFMFSPLGSFMTHMKGNKKDGVQEPQKVPALVPFKVNPYDCVPSTALVENILTNLKKINSYVTFCSRDKKRKAHMVSAGPSVSKYYNKLKKAQARGETIFCVKHSYPKLLKAGIIPDYCVIIDPRPVDGVSTHGIVRKDLFEEIHPNTKFLTATMTHPSVVDYLLEKGATIIGWHAFSKEFQIVSQHLDPVHHKYSLSVPIGTCSAIRGIGIIDSLGFGSCTLYGYDSSHKKVPLNPTDKDMVIVLLKGSTQPLVINPQLTNVKDFGAEVKRFYTTGELVALYQDFMSIIPQIKTMTDMKLKVEYSKDTLIGAGWSTHLENVKKQAKEVKDRKSTALKYNDYISNLPVIDLSISPEVEAKILESVV